MQEDKASAGILLNGRVLDVDINDDYIICADGGYRLLKNKSSPDIIIGDFDSLKDIIPKDIPIIRHNSHKNQTDGEICLEYAIKKGYKQINLYSALSGKRSDHILGNLALLKLAYLQNCTATIKEKEVYVYYTEGEFSLRSVPNDILSIIPFDTEATIESSKGLYYPLENLTISSHRTRGISNIATDSKIFIKVKEGGILIFHYFN